jgi:hypothetical protein
MSVARSSSRCRIGLAISRLSCLPAFNIDDTTDSGNACYTRTSSRNYRKRLADETHVCVTLCREPNVPSIIKWQCYRILAGVLLANFGPTPAPQPTVTLMDQGAFCASSLFSVDSHDLPLLGEPERPHFVMFLCSADTHRFFVL